MNSESPKSEPVGASLSAQTPQNDRLMRAISLLGRVNLESPPDENWCRDYFLLTGEHMIRTDEGWEPGSVKQAYLDDFAKHPDWGNPILDEINVGSAAQEGDCPCGAMVVRKSDSANKSKLCADCAAQEEAPQYPIRLNAAQFKEVEDWASMPNNRWGDATARRINLATFARMILKGRGIVSGFPVHIGD